MISLSIRITNIDSVPIITDMYRNIVRFSDAKGFNPDLNSFIIYVFPKDKNKLWNSQQNVHYYLSNHQLMSISNYIFLNIMIFIIKKHYKLWD